MKLMVLLALLLAPFQSAPERADYAVGQVWEYRTRPGEEGSLLSIRHAEKDPRGEPIYHIAIIGLKVHADDRAIEELPHLPVSRKTLDASVIRLATRTATFPDGSEGIATWREAKGGVFTISVAEIVETLEASLRTQ
ncbi:hypothetical protein TPR58_14985 [Sphingomonas sp. HF-S3]|uniref:Uncharacterized protein n=1 Tax=Sphingomonas rustica TaxID=3103142 RepID=A0ABV0BA78_9SPHN